MPIKVVLAQPVVGIRKDTLFIETLPAGALLEVGSELGNGTLAILCEGACFTLLAEDLLDACSVQDVGRITSGRVANLENAED